MNKKNQAKKFAKKATALATVFGMAASLIPAVPMQVKAAEFAGKLTEVKSVETDISRRRDFPLQRRPVRGFFQVCHTKE